jgi:hypothetical protein
VRRRTFKVCAACERPAKTACVDAGHVVEVRTLPTWWIRYYRNGLWHEESPRTDKFTEAERPLKQREGDVARGRRGA